MAFASVVQKKKEKGKKRKLANTPCVPKFCLWGKFLKTGSAADMHVTFN